MKKCFYTEKGPKAIGPYCTAVLCGDVYYLSGMIGLDPATGRIAAADAEGQAKQAIANVETVLSELGLTAASVVKTTVFLTDLNDFGKVNAIYAEHFGPDYPARSCVQVAALPAGALVEIEAVAAAK